MGEIFTVADVSLITSIHLSKQIFSDKLIWRHSMNGMFIVKFAYYVARQVLGKVVHLAYNRLKLWKIIRKAKVTSKVKFFVWRMVQGIFPIDTFF